MFQEALTLQPSRDEARAALYNSACCYAKQRQWQPAVDAVTAAVNDYDLKLTVAINVRRLLCGRAGHVKSDCVGAITACAVRRAGLLTSALTQVLPPQRVLLELFCWLP